MGLSEKEKVKKMSLFPDFNLKSGSIKAMLLQLLIEGKKKIRYYIVILYP